VWRDRHWADQPGERSCRRRLAKRLHRQGPQGHRLPEQVDAVFSGLALGDSSAPLADSARGALGRGVRLKERAPLSYEG
jgi:hypothetical protein